MFGHILLWFGGLCCGVGVMCYGRGKSYRSIGDGLVLAGAVFTVIGGLCANYLR